MKLKFYSVLKIFKQSINRYNKLECIFGIAHQNANSLYDIEKTLNTNNYKLIAIEKGGNILSFSNYQTNLIYVRQKIFDEIKKFHEKNIDIKNVTYSV